MARAHLRVAIRSVQATTEVSMIRRGLRGRANAAVILVAVCLWPSPATMARAQTPALTPIVNECDPSAPACPVGTECYCCCGAFRCAPPFAPCCAIPCVSPTPTPAPGPCDVCDGRPCTGFLIRSGTCQPTGDQCTCVPNTPAPGECALACDSRPCVDQCPDGSRAQQFCTAITVDQGCECEEECTTPAP